MEETNKLEETSKAINLFIDEYEGYLFADRNEKLKPQIDRFIKELDGLTDTISKGWPIQTNPRSSHAPRCFSSRPGSWTCCPSTKRAQRSS